MNSVRLNKILDFRVGKFINHPLGGCVAVICLAGCATADHSGGIVAKQWNSHFTQAGGEAATPWSGGTPGMPIADFVYEGIAVKDYEYKKYVDLIRRGTSWSGFGAQTAAIGLNAAGTLTTAGTTKILSAAAGSLSGASAAFSKNILFDQSITTFVGRMDALRADKLTYIQKRLTQPDYGFAEAYRDVEDYGRLGSLDAALTDVAKQSGIQEAAAKDASPNATSTPSTTSTTTTTTTTNGIASVQKLKASVSSAPIRAGPTAMKDVQEKKTSAVKVLRQLSDSQAANALQTIKTKYPSWPIAETGTPKEIIAALLIDTTDKAQVENILTELQMAKQ